jgi:hypothetical protein
MITQVGGKKSKANKIIIAYKSKSAKFMHELEKTAIGKKTRPVLV